jgi:putative transposase
VSAKYEFIDGEKYAYPIAKMCTWLAVSRAGFYEWRGRPASATAERRARLAEQIAAVFAASRQTYGTGGCTPRWPARAWCAARSWCGS